ncbi:MAG: hypothetical protein DLM66_05380 [Candidatus Dormiibacter spiritus]|nr:MAG: hypothetical protein DLM66_05380 [Candidatus Dormibacteraeota bacterium]
MLVDGNRRSSIKRQAPRPTAKVHQLRYDACQMLETGLFVIGFLYVALSFAAIVGLFQNRDRLKRRR